MTINPIRTGGGGGFPLLKKSSYNPYLKFLDFSQLLVADTPMKFFFRKILSTPSDSTFMTPSTKTFFNFKTKNIFLYWVSQKCCKQNFSKTKFHRGIRNQKLGKVKKFQVLVVRIFFE